MLRGRLVVRFPGRTALRVRLASDYRLFQPSPLLNLACRVADTGLRYDKFNRLSDQLKNLLAGRQSAVINIPPFDHSNPLTSRSWPLLHIAIPVT